jgi:hypothetical protein
MNTISNSDSDLNSREELSEDVNNIWGDECVRESIRQLVRVHISKVCAPTTPCFDVFNRSYHTEPRNMELSRNGKWGILRAHREPKSRGKSRSCCEAVARMDATFLERMRQIHIGPPRVYPAVGAMPNISIDYTVTSDFYSTFVTAHFLPRQFGGSSNQSSKIHLTHALMERTKEHSQAA